MESRERNPRMPDILEVILQPAGLPGTKEGDGHCRVDVRPADVSEAMREDVDRQTEAPHPDLGCEDRGLPHR